MAYGYDKNKDYSALIKKAVDAGDFASAAIYEQQRNEKIKGEGITEYQTSNLYSSFLPGTSKFQNPYAADLQTALSGMQDVGAYRKSYLREADRTMRDTLGQVGRMTGGLPSTQAVAAASQAADYTKSQLDSKVQALQQSNFNALMNATQQAQSEWQTNIDVALNRWNQLGYADQQVADILGVPVGTSTADQSYRNWQIGQQEKSDAYSMAMNLLSAGQMPSAEMLASAGISSEDAQKLLVQPAVVYSGGGSSGTDEPTTAGKPIPYEDRVELLAMYQAEDANLNAKVAAMNAMGYDTDEFWEWLLTYYSGVGDGGGSGAQGYSGPSGQDPSSTVPAWQRLNLKP